MAEKQKTYELDGTMYHLHYTIGRLEQIEQATGSSVVSAVYGAVRQQMMPLSLLLMLFAYGMMSEDGVYAPLKKAAAYAQERLGSDGYSEMFLCVVEQLQEDCGFLFQ